MKTIGIDAEQLFIIGLSEQAADDGVIEVLEDKEIMSNPPFIKPAIEIAKEEAIIKAVAKMIEANNAELLKQLKAAGVIADQ